MDHFNKYMKKCAVCGKEFICINPQDYAYKRTVKDTQHFTCSYKCFRKHEKENPVLPYNDVVRLK